MTATLGASRHDSPAMCAARFLGPIDAVDAAVMARAVAPILDVGCGPGRHVTALAERGKVALGIDITPMAVSLARRRGAPVLERSVFERVPGTGRWATALLLDGNIGIGGSPMSVLRRVFTLLRPSGVVIVETRAPGSGRQCERVQLEIDGVRGPSFAWRVLGADELAAEAARAGSRVIETWSDGGRWFGTLGRG